MESGALGLGGAILGGGHMQKFRYGSPSGDVATSVAHSINPSAIHNLKSIWKILNISDRVSLSLRVPTGGGICDNFTGVPLLGIYCNYWGITLFSLW